jgi:PAS domain S-box-containing protein
MTRLRLLEYCNDALFVGLAGVCYVQWRRRGGRAAGWLAVTFGTLGAAVLVGLALAANPAAAAAQWVAKLLLAVVVLFPYLLFRFTACLDRAARRTEVVVGVLTATVVAWTLLLPSLPAQGAPQPRWLRAYLVAILVQWTAVSIVASGRLWWAGRGQPTAARRRTRALSLAAMGLSLTLVVSGLAPSSRAVAFEVAVRGFTLASALLFYLAFAPPKMLRTAWLQPEQETLRRAMNELMSVSRAEDVAACLLPHVISMVGGRGAALLDASGQVLGSRGQTPGLADPTAGTVLPDVVRLSLSAGGSGGLKSEAPTQGGSGHAEPSGSPPVDQGSLLVWTSPYAPVFGRQELDLLQAAGNLAELTLERVRHAERDSALAAVVDASADAIVSTGLDGTIRSWNAAAEVIYDRPAGEAVGKALREVVAPDGADDLAELLRRVGAGDLVRLEARHARRDGSPISVALTAAPLRDRSGAVAGASLVARDITDRKRAEEALEQAKLAAEQANQAKSEYLSRMSHELRTPLNAILGFAQLLELDELSDEQHQSLSHILSAARHLLGLINEVLDIAAIEAGRLALSLEPVAVAEVVSETVSLIRPLADQQGILLGTPAQSCDQHVLGDRQRLKQILLNLVSNAVKYNHQGGSVQVSCQRVGGEHLRIKVRDTGPGIPAGSVERLFVPFERLENQHSGVEGAGLGLPLSRRLAEAMGGTLDLASAEGQGSTFWVELPLTEGPVQRAARERRNEAPHAEAGQEEHAQEAEPSLTVLYIEDNLSNLQLVERVLGRRRGVKLISAMRPQLGLDLAGEHHPDLILLDLHLPDMPGQEVLRRLQANPATAGIPVVVLSADARSSLIQELRDQGARAFLTKPLDVKELLGLLDTVAEEREPAG